MELRMISCALLVRIQLDMALPTVVLGPNHRPMCRCSCESVSSIYQTRSHHPNSTKNEMYWVSPVSFSIGVIPSNVGMFKALCDRMRHCNSKHLSQNASGAFDACIDALRYIRLILRAIDSEKFWLGVCTSKGWIMDSACLSFLEKSPATRLMVLSVGQHCRYSEIGMEEV